VYIEGRLQTRSWEQDGVTRYTTEIVVDTFTGVMQMLDSRNSGQSYQPNNVVPISPTPEINNNQSSGLADLDDDFDNIPF